VHEAANTLMMYYRKKGYFAAKVFIPPHSVHDGIVTLHVYEGHLEENGIRLENSEGRVKSEIIMRLLESTLKPGIIKSSFNQ
jgi:hemolysin activation/secretion protein